MIIGRTAKSVTELLYFLRAIYGGGFLPIPTDSYSDVTFSHKLSGTVTKVSFAGSGERHGGRRLRMVVARWNPQKEVIGED